MTDMRSTLLLSACLLFLSSAGWVRAEPVILLRDVPLLAEPTMGAPEVAKVVRGTAGESVEKRGIWVHVKTADSAGWVYSFNVRFGDRPAASGKSGLSGFFAPRPRTSVTSTIGIRGLSEEELRNASFNKVELDRLVAFGASREQAEARAAEAGLQAFEFPYMASPEAAENSQPSKQRHPGEGS